ncbi:MAG: DUF4321 domain-containing protein [Candidatus Latescibacterota bacterium]|nr:DUF4321 domain-containing protein [Candidatus Latescibacterota bacterium]
MLRDKPVSHLILILFTTMLGANIIGEVLRVLLTFVAGTDTIVERALLQYVSYSIGPHMFNLIILSFSFELSLRFNLATLLGMFVGWYYFRYSY